MTNTKKSIFFFIQNFQTIAKQHKHNRHGQCARNCTWDQFSFIPFYSWVFWIQSSFECCMLWMMKNKAKATLLWCTEMWFSWSFCCFNNPQLQFVSSEFSSMHIRSHGQEMYITQLWPQHKLDGGGECVEKNRNDHTHTHIDIHLTIWTKTQMMRIIQLNWMWSLFSDRKSNSNNNIVFRIVMIC